MNLGNKKLNSNETKEILKEVSGIAKPSDEEVERIKKQLQRISEVKDFITKKN